MEGQVILTTPSQLKLLLVEAVSIALKYHQPTSVTASQPSPTAKLDFPSVMKEYYPGIPESTVRQDTAHLSRTKVGKRILLDRAEIEEHQRKNLRCSTSEIEHNAETQFTNQHRSRGGRKVA